MSINLINFVPYNCSQGTDLVDQIRQSILFHFSLRLVALLLFYNSLLLWLWLLWHSIVIVVCSNKTTKQFLWLFHCLCVCVCVVVRCVCLPISKSNNTKSVLQCVGVCWLVVVKVTCASRASWSSHFAVCWEQTLYRYIRIYQCFR